ncbi:MAG: hypothetical protein ACXVB1_14510 [Pseudobdellovibrionaceae bacterium]
MTLKFVNLRALGAGCWAPSRADLHEGAELDFILESQRLGGGEVVESYHSDDRVPEGLFAIREVHVAVLVIDIHGDWCIGLRLGEHRGYQGQD